MKTPNPNFPQQPARSAAPPVYRPTLQTKPDSPANAGLTGLRKGTRAFVPLLSTTIQRLPKTHKDYQKWRTKTEEHNIAHSGFKIDFEKKWAEAENVPAFIRVLKAQTDKASQTALAPRLQGPPVELPRKTPSLPVTSPSVPTVKTPPRSAPKQKEEEKILDAIFKGAPLSSGATQTQIIVDPLAGLSPNVRNWAQGILTWNQNAGMAGFGQATMTQTQQEELTNWVLGRTTKAGNQKFAVIIGQGSGMYSEVKQYKVIGYKQRNDGTAITYHISLTPHSYAPALLPAFFGF